MSTPQIQQVCIKFPFANPATLDLDAFIPLFHAWIAEGRIEHELLIDVADYRHVPDGPGVMLIANQAHYAIDSGGGSVGLLYSRRRDEPQDAEAAFRFALARAAQAALLIESEIPALTFDPAHVEMRVASRLVAPNTTETRLALEPLWTQVLETVGYAEPTFVAQGDPREVFGLVMQSCAAAPKLAILGETKA